MFKLRINQPKLTWFVGELAMLLQDKARETFPEAHVGSAGMLFNLKVEQSPCGRHKELAIGASLSIFINDNYYYENVIRLCEYHTGERYLQTKRVLKCDDIQVRCWRQNYPSTKRVREISLNDMDKIVKGILERSE